MNATVDEALKGVIATLWENWRVYVFLRFLLVMFISILDTVEQASICEGEVTKRRRCRAV